MVEVTLGEDGNKPLANLELVVVPLEKKRKCIIFSLCGGRKTFPKSEGGTHKSTRSRVHTRVVTAFDLYLKQLSRPHMHQKAASQELEVQCC